MRPSGQTAPTPIPDDDCSGLTQAPRRPAAVACDQSDRKRSRQLTHTLHVLCVGATTSFGIPVFAEVTHRGAGARSRRMPIQYFKCTGEGRFSTSNASAESGECQSTTLNAPQWQPPAPPAAIWGTLCMTVLAFLPSPPRFVTLRNETYNFQLHTHRVDCWSYCWGRPQLNSVRRVDSLPLFCFPDLTKNATGQGK